ncbi:hypothetical protein [Ekhidna sp.]|uniref:hypothetical protein n=1 Tax=Ekhidna sp. TaxID=2608089 RepID=UPI003B500EAD
MIYRLRHFENNHQIVSSLGWILVIVGIVVLFIGPIPGAIIFILIGAFLIWLQLRGKRITVDTEAKTVKAGGKTQKLSNPSLVFMKEIRMSQNINSRVNSANVKTYFYMAYIQDDTERILISCNRNDQRDLDKLKKIAGDLNIPFQLEY